MRAYGSAAWISCSKRCWSRTEAVLSRTCATARFVVAAEAIVAPGAICSERTALTPHTTPSTATPPAEPRRWRAATLQTRTAATVMSTTISARPIMARTSVV